MRSAGALTLIENREARSRCLTTIESVGLREERVPRSRFANDAHLN